jgi:hypothetical protein
VRQIEIEQLLHGYQNGHELLASSIRLPSSDAELIARLSDLSGSLLENRFQPYLTTYPLPSGTHYAFARTWLDEGARRRGCVLTHTLLIPLSVWASETVDPFSIFDVFKTPSRQDVKSYRRALVIENQETSRPLNVDIDPSSQLAFVDKYFGEGIKPVVWFGEKDSDLILLLVLRSLWPRLRECFAGCSFSLQPRVLPTGPFDLLLTPSSAHSRFSRVPQENLLHSRGEIAAISRVEPWCHGLAKAIFSVGRTRDRWSEFSTALDSDPRSVRRLYLLYELRDRAIKSPTAALGMMDIIESLAPNPIDHLELKQSVVDRALESNGQSQLVNSAAGNLRFVCERLTHPAFGRVADASYSTIVKAVSRQARAKLESTLSDFERLLSIADRSDKIVRAYREGVVEVLKLPSDSASSQVRVLSEFPTAASDLAANCPSVVGRYIHAVKPFGAHEVLSWIRAGHEWIDWEPFAKEVLPATCIVNDGDIVADEILKHLHEWDIPWALDSLMRGRVLGQSSFQHVVLTRFVNVYPKVVRDWAFKSIDESDDVSKVAAMTFGSGLDGVVKALADGRVAKCQGARVLADIILSSESSGWLPEVAAQDDRLVPVLWSCGSASPKNVLHCLYQVTAAVQILPVGSLRHAPKAIQEFGGEGIGNHLVDLIVRSCIIHRLKGQLGDDQFDLLMGEAPCKEWLSTVQGSRLIEIIGRRSFDRPQDCRNIWSFLASAPSSLLESRTGATLDVVDQLMSLPSRKWIADLGDLWTRFLERTEAHAARLMYVRHCVRAVQFAFRRPFLPLGPVIAKSFPMVYWTAMQDPKLQSETDCLFSYIDWDRGKELRKSLVDSYMSSDWPPGDLAIVAARTFGIRKLFRRILRKWGGEEYLNRIVRDLSKRADPSAGQVRDEILQLVRYPDFTEAWD